MSQLETIVLTNAVGMSVDVINVGARIKSIKFPVNAKPMEMTLGYRSSEEYLSDEFYLGATCGRVCNRIAGGKFELNGHQYQLPLNDGENCLHGGDNNFSLRYWHIDRKTISHNSVTLRLVSEHGDQGFPGTLNLSVTYQLCDNNRLSVVYTGDVDVASPVNITNHTYFNLGEKDCLSLHLALNASKYLETDTANIPTGKMNTVLSTHYDFNQSVSIGDREGDKQSKYLNENNGYDHCFVLDDTADDQPNAVLTSLENNVSMSIYTNQSTIQLYTGYYLSGEFTPYQGVCLEAQNYVDAENNKHFPSNVLKPNQPYNQHIIFEFSSIN